MAKRKPNKGKSSRGKQPNRPAAGRTTVAVPSRDAGGRKPTRSERIGAAQAELRSRQQRTRLLIGGAIAVVLILIVGSQVVGKRGASAFRDEVTSGSCRFDTRSDPTAAAPNNHVASPSYEIDPPAGGNHLVTAAEPGVYGQDELPPDGELVHALEHGYVILWHKPDLPAADVETLEAVAEEYDRDTLVVARASLPVQVAATSWGKRLLCGEVEPVALRKMIERYRNQGPEKVPH